MTIRADAGPQRQRITAFTVTVVFLISALGMIVGLGLSGWRVNLTPSEPLGLWRIVPLDRDVRHGDLVFVCPPDTPAIRQARRRGYLRNGACDGGVAPLIKTVAATPGQAVAVGDHVLVDGKRLAHSRVMTNDAMGRPMTPYRGGIVQPGSVYLHSNFQGSFDSRYFGPLPVANIVGLARKVWTYDR